LLGMSNVLARHSTARMSSGSMRMPHLLAAAPLGVPRHQIALASDQAARLQAGSTRQQRHPAAAAAAAACGAPAGPARRLSLPAVLLPGSCCSGWP
jgi:hypothetical protein